MIRMKVVFAECEELRPQRAYLSGTFPNWEVLRYSGGITEYTTRTPDLISAFHGRDTDGRVHSDRTLRPTQTRPDVKSPKAGTSD